METIGGNAFRGCTELDSIALPASVTHVGDAAFTSCENLVRATFAFSDKAVTLGDNLFMQCWHLTEVTLPQKADRIGAGMFQSCLSLSGLYIPKSVTFLYRYAGSPEASGSGFDDVPTNEYYYAPVIWAVSKGVTNGMGDGNFSPLNNCTRGQIVTFLYRDQVRQ